MVLSYFTGGDLKVFKRWIFLTFFKIFLPFLDNFVHFYKKAIFKKLGS